MKLPGKNLVPCPTHTSPIKTHTTPAIPLIQASTITPYPTLREPSRLSRRHSPSISVAKCQDLSRLAQSVGRTGPPSLARELGRVNPHRRAQPRRAGGGLSLPATLVGPCMLACPAPSGR